MIETLKALAARLHPSLKSAGDSALFAGAVLVTAVLESARLAPPLALQFLKWLGGIWRASTSSQRKLAVLGLAAIAALTLLPSRLEMIGHWYEATFTNRRPLYHAKSWFYHLADLDLEKVARSDADLIVIDHGFGGDARNPGKVTPLRPEQVARAKKKPNGETRLAISYFSIGEAENYRLYWQDNWADGAMPSWHVAENCAWPKNHMVRFWQDGWKNIIYRSKNSYLAQIIAQGFDGVYLDRIDVFWEQMQERPTARDDMIDFVTELAATARSLKPGFLVIAQNAEDLLAEKRYRDVIDGLGKEDLLFGHDGTGARNAAKDIEESLAGIGVLQWDWKPVFAVEYLPKQELIEAARAEMLSLGLVPTFAHRSLDGGDPTAARPASSIKYGTPEWIKEKCQDKRHW